MDRNTPDHDLPINPLLQRLARNNISTIIILYSLLVTILIIKALTNLTLLLTLGLFLIGIIGWTLLEYIIHRYVFHCPIQHPTFKKFQYYMHGYHHFKPTDHHRLHLPLIITIPTVLILYPLCQLMFHSYADPIFAGFVIGYILYDTIHYCVHRYNFKHPFGRFLKQYHFHHHFKANQRRYGVSSPLWDYVFKTQDSNRR